MKSANHHRIPLAASQERGWAVRRKVLSAPKAAAGLAEGPPLEWVHRGLPGTRKAAVSPGTGAVRRCGLSPVRSWTSSLGFGFTDCHF